MRKSQSEQGEYTVYAYFKPVMKGDTGKKVRWCATDSLAWAQQDASNCYRAWTGRDAQFARAIVEDENGYIEFEVASPMACIG